MGSYKDGDRPASRRTANGSRWRRVARAVLDQQGTLCVVCGHGGSDAVDHLLPVRERPDLEWDFSNLRPIHHKPCMTCSEAAGRNVSCNYIKSFGTLNTAKRLVHERTGLPVPGYSTEGRTCDEPDSSWW